METDKVSLSSRSQSSGFSGINVTPLTDVMLVLLITFLLSANSFESTDLTVPLPQVVEAREVEKYALVLQVGETGEVEWPDPALSKLDLQQALQKLKLSTQETTLALGVHRDCPYGELYPVAEAAVLAGWNDVVLLTVAENGVQAP